MNDGPLIIHSDLTFSVDGPGGPSSGRIEAAGSRLTVHASDPVAAMDAAFGARGPASNTPAAVANFLAERGLTVDVVGPRGPVVTLGAGVQSAVGGLVSGSRHVRLGSPRGVTPFLAARLTPTASVRRGLLFGAAVAAALLASAVVRRRGDPSRRR